MFDQDYFADNFRRVFGTTVNIESFDNGDDYEINFFPTKMKHIDKWNDISRNIPYEPELCELLYQDKTIKSVSDDVLQYRNSPNADDIYDDNLWQDRLCIIKVSEADLLNDSQTQLDYQWDNFSPNQQQYIKDKMKSNRPKDHLEEQSGYIYFYYFEKGDKSSKKPMPVVDNNVERVITKGCPQNSTPAEKNSVIKKIYDYENDRVRKINSEKGSYYNSAEKWRKMNIDRNPLDAPDGQATIELDAREMEQLNLNLLRQALKDNNNPAAKYMLMALQDYQGNPQQVSDYAKNCLLRARSTMLSNPQNADFKFLNSAYQQIEPLVLKRVENIEREEDRPALKLLDIHELDAAVKQYEIDKAETGVGNPIMERLRGFVKMKGHSGSVTAKELFDFVLKSSARVDIAERQDQFYHVLMRDPKRGKQRPARDYLSRFPNLFKAVTGRDCPEARKMAKDKYLDKTVDKQGGAIVFDPPGGGECGPAAAFLAFVACANEENMNNFRECYIDEVMTRLKNGDREQIGMDFDRDLREFIYDGAEVTPFLKNVVLAMRRYSVKTEVEVNMAYIMGDAYFTIAGEIRSKLNEKMKLGDKSLVKAYAELRDDGLFSPKTFERIKQDMKIKFERRLTVRQKVIDKIDGEGIKNLQQAAAELRRDKEISDKDYNDFIDSKDVYLEKHPEFDKKLKQARLKIAASVLRDKDVDNAEIYEKILGGEVLSKEDWGKVEKAVDRQLFEEAASRLLAREEIKKKDYDEIVSKGSLYLNQHPDVALRVENESFKVEIEHLLENAQFKIAASTLKKEDVANVAIYKKILEGKVLSKEDWQKVSEKLNKQVVKDAASRLLKREEIKQEEYDEIVSSGNLYLNNHPDIALKIKDEKTKMGREYLKENGEMSDAAYYKLTEDDYNLSYRETELALSSSKHAPTGKQLKQATKNVGPEYHNPNNPITRGWRNLFGMVNNPGSVSAKVEQAVRKQNEDSLTPQSLRRVIHSAVDEEVRKKSEKVGRFSFGKKLAIQLDQDQLRRVCDKLGYEFYAEEVVPLRKRISRGFKELFLGKAQTGPIGELTNLEQGVGPKVIMKMFSNGDLVVNRVGQPQRNTDPVPRVSIDLAEPEDIEGEENYCNIKYTINYSDTGHASQSGIVKVPKKDMDNDEEIMNLIVKSGTNNNNQHARADLVKYGHDEYMYNGYPHDKLVVLRNIPTWFTYHWQLITPNQQAKNLLYGHEAAANDRQLVQKNEDDRQKRDDGKFEMDLVSSITKNNKLNETRQDSNELDKTKVKQSFINESTMYGNTHTNVNKTNSMINSHAALIDGMRFICKQELSQGQNSLIKKEINKLRGYLKEVEDDTTHQFSDKELDGINQALEDCKNKFKAPLQQHYKGRVGLQPYNMVKEVQTFQANCQIVQDEIKELKLSSQDGTSVHY